MKQAFAAGIGATITTTVGGTLDPQRFHPLPITAKVRLLADGRFRSESFGEEWFAGPTAVLEVDNFTLVVSSRAVNLYDRSFFYAHGQDPKRFDAVVVKSPHCQHHMYADWCARMVNVDAPGSSSANLPLPRPHPLPASHFPARCRGDLRAEGKTLSTPRLIVIPRLPMKIREIRCAGLRGATPEGGWSNELRPDDCVHTLVAVHTDEGRSVSAASSPTMRSCAPRSPCWSRSIAAKIDAADVYFGVVRARRVAAAAALAIARAERLKSGVHRARHRRALDPARRHARRPPARSGACRRRRTAACPGRAIDQLDLRIEDRTCGRTIFPTASSTPLIPHQAQRTAGSLRR